MKRLRKNVHILIKINFFSRSMHCTRVLDSGQRARACTPRTGCDFLISMCSKRKREREMVVTESQDGIRVERKGMCRLLR